MEMFFIYAVVTTVLFFVLLPFYIVIRRLQGKRMSGWKEKMGIFSVPDLGDKVILFHGVSVGETIALENLIKKTKETFPDYKLVVTTGTQTGQDVANKKFADVADFITYFPYDIPFFVKSFLDKINPTVALIAETEMWPAFAFECKKRGIKLFMINGRISDSTFNLYKAFGIFFKPVLAQYTKLLTQSQQDNEKLLSLGADKNKTFVMKNLKFDIKRQSASIDIGQNGYRVIIAGSTHKGEDEIILNAFSLEQKNFSDIKLLLVPRHTTRLPKILPILDSLSLSYGFRSKGDTFKDYDVIILDTMGELGKMYSICHFAFIGGSFNKTGGHNPLEATVYSKPTITGPCIHNFKDIYGLLAGAQAAKIVKTPKELQSYMNKLLSDKDFYEKTCDNCENIFNDQQGALDFVINQLSETLN